MSSQEEEQVEAVRIARASWILQVLWFQIWFEKNSIQ